MEGAAPDRSYDVVVFSDYVCPFCYVAEAALARLRAEGLVVERRAFELRPVPVPLPDLERGHYRATYDQLVLPLARRAGVEIVFPKRSLRTRKAHEAAAYARDRGALEPMHAALMRAHFVEGRDIGRIDVLVSIGESVGLDRSGLKVALDIDQYTARIEADAALAATLGIRAVPAYVREDGGQRQVQLGARDADVLRAWLRNGTEGRRAR